ncbi:uncharacterized protein NPIL_185951 [Nephila pilipes]|uniref:MULE transposase domain-containing protein n=1 Tax=Nephila pilipes TaxID=299642 RepID=A0A8X6TI39_NEPPI|nr:uncharacterized protein NPIL_185951 [Nephila pilipes]
MGEKTSFYLLYHSGFYVSKGKGLRHLKTQGSNKIDGYCPAEIKVFISETGSNAIKHKDDGTSVDAWVNEMESKNDSCILFYKPQGVTSAMYPELKSNDFVLGIMNDAQCEMLKKYVSHICIDGIHGTNGYDFELITLLTLDDMRQGFPCSFFTSNRTDHFVLQIFFAKIKEKIGEICPTVFMSDMAESFFNAWSNSFQSKPKHRLFCTWCVDRAWRKNLQKIQSREMQLEVNKILRTLMEEKDADAFNIMFNEVIKKILANMTREFCKYFVENHANCINSWAYFHRLQSGLNTNIHVESMHKSLKYIYLKGRNAKRLDKTIYALMRFVRDKLVDRLIVVNKGKLTSKLKNLQQRHKTSLSFSTALLIENESGYIVPSLSSHETYLVQESNINCSCCKDCCFPAWQKIRSRSSEDQDFPILDQGCAADTIHK